MSFLLILEKTKDNAEVILFEIKVTFEKYCNYLIKLSKSVLMS